MRAREKARDRAGSRASRGESSHVTPFPACRLVALTRCPGVIQLRGTSWALEDALCVMSSFGSAVMLGVLMPVPRTWGFQEEGPGRLVALSTLISWPCARHSAGP